MKTPTQIEQGNMLGKQLTLQRELLSQFTTYSFPDDYFETTGKDKTTQFDRDCSKILDGFKMKFLAGGRGDRKKYLDTFSGAKWHRLPVVEKKEHSLSNCIRCFEQRYDIQRSFPLKPMFTHKPLIAVDLDALQRQGIKKFTGNVLTELNRAYDLEAGTSFTNAVAANRSSCSQKKPTPEESRKKKNHLKKEFTQMVNVQFAEKATILMLAECESKRKYHRKRLLQSFSSPPTTQPLRKHSPKFSEVSWDTGKLKETLESWPPNSTINWSALAREHGIPGKNTGQVAKEFAMERKIDTSHIVTPKRKANVRPKIMKLSKSRVSIPSNPTLSAVETEIGEMLHTGRFTLGVECAPHTLTKYKVINGVMTPHDLHIQGRKVPLTEIRQHL
jgi:hypothetical protein